MRAMESLNIYTLMFDVLLLSIVYKVSPKEIQKNYVLTKTKNNLKPPEGIWNQLKPPETTKKLP